MIICWNNILYILSKIKFIIKINFTCFFFFTFFVNVTIRKLKVTYVVCVILPLDSAALEDTANFVLHTTDLQILEVWVVP